MKELDDLIRQVSDAKLRDDGTVIIPSNIKQSKRWVTALEYIEMKGYVLVRLTGPATILAACYGCHHQIEFDIREITNELDVPGCSCGYLT